MAGTSGGPISNLLASLSGAFALSGGGTSIGLSVGSSSVKMVELRKKGKSWELLNFSMMQLPEEVVVNREIIQPVPVVDAIKSLVAGTHPKTKDVCTSISGTSLMIKRLSLEVQNPKEIQEQVFWEAEQYLPFDAADVVMDYQVLSKHKDKRVDVLLVAAKRSVVESFMGVVRDSGLRPSIVDVDFFALQNYFETNYPVNEAEAVALVDIGAVGLKVAVVSGGVPIFTKDTALGGRNLTQEIQKHLNLSFVDAEALKVAGQHTGTPQEVSDLMHLMAENYGTEIKRAIDFYQASSSGPPVSYVLISGGGAKIPNLTHTIEEMVRLPVQMANPFNSITYNEAVFRDGIAEIAPFAAIPVGLALRGAAK